MILMCIQCWNSAIETNMEVNRWSVNYKVCCMLVTMATLSESESQEELEEKNDQVHLDVPHSLTRTVSLNDTKVLLSMKSGKYNDLSISSSNSETDLRRYFLSPKAIRRSVSVNEYSSELPKSPLAVRFHLSSDEEVFEFPHTRSPISLKVNIKWPLTPMAPSALLQGVIYSLSKLVVIDFTWTWKREKTKSYHQTNYTINYNYTGSL